MQHLRISLFIYVFLLLIGLVESSGWVKILWVSIISYGVIAIERWAHELSDLFGLDVSDLNTHAATNNLWERVQGRRNYYGISHGWPMLENVCASAYVDDVVFDVSGSISASALVQTTADQLHGCW